MSALKAKHFPVGLQEQGIDRPEVSVAGVNGEQVTMIKVHMKKGFHEDMHRHVHEQIFYIEKGCVRILLKGQEPMDVKAGEFILLPSFVDHEALALEDSISIDVFTPARPELFKKA